MSIAITLATYRRPELLASLLPVLCRQADALPEPCRIVVVDNDPATSAQAVVEGVARGSVEVVYVAEPRPGIAAARNAALDQTTQDDAVVFIDDDERPADDWLHQLVSHWRAWGCAGVVGPVVSELPDETSEWVRASGMFAREQHPQGANVRVAATNNLILDRRKLRALGLRFDERFGLTGGSDTMLTRALTSHGEQIRFCREAVMTEQVPAERATRDWVLRRAYRVGTVHSRVNLAVNPAGMPRLRVRCRLFVRGARRIITGQVSAIVGRFRHGPAASAAGEAWVARGRGVIAGALGRQYVEYARPTMDAEQQ
ncbi:MAG: glycosyltransferase family 2 protein [Nocardioidaceae bacterium]